MKDPFVPGYYYHIFNRGNNKRPLFNCAEDYLHFLDLYSIYANPVLETFSWCLIKNHYHFCVRIKHTKELGCFDKRNRLSKDAVTKWKMFSFQDIPEKHQIVPNPERMLSFMFNAYARYYNTRYSSTGAVFERGIERRLIDSEKYLMDAIIYINNNPVRHKISKTPQKYRWSSYNEIINGSSRFCSLQGIMKVFDNKENFIEAHQNRNVNGPRWDDF